MRKPRVLEAHAWYLVSTAANRHEPLFLERNAADLFKQTLRETGEHFAFELCGLDIEPDSVSFYIKPADGFQLPFIMQWLKQTFAVRYNVMKRLDGHVWGDRYRSKPLEGEPPEGGILAKEAGRGDCGEGTVGARSLEAVPREEPSGGDSHHEGEMAENTRLPPNLPRRTVL
jgi:REP element-mobilizing transposase RayT